MTYRLRTAIRGGELAGTGEIIVGCGLKPCQADQAVRLRTLASLARRAWPSYSPRTAPRCRSPFFGRFASRVRYLFFWKNSPGDCLDLRIRLGLALQMQTASSSPNKPCVYNSLSQRRCRRFVCVHVRAGKRPWAGGRYRIPSYMSRPERLRMQLRDGL